MYALGHDRDPVRYSRHCTRFADVGAGDGVQDRFLEWLEQGPGEGVVLPCADDGLELVARRRARIEELGYTTIEANDEVVLAMLDKQRTAELAAELGVEAPRTEAVRSFEQGRAAGVEIGFPCAIKPLHSHLFAHHFGLLQKVFVVDDVAQLETRLAQTLELGLEVLVTEIVFGPERNFGSLYVYLDEQGEPLLQVTKRKLRQFPPDFGLPCYQLTDWDPDVAETGIRFLRGAGARGFASVEFKRDGRDGRLRLIECNHRFTGSTEHLRASGVDIAQFTYCRLTGRPGPSVDSYRKGLGFWYPLRDARALLTYRKRGELTVFAWLRSLIRPQSFPIARVDDPLPSLATGARRLGRLALRLRPGSG